MSMTGAPSSSNLHADTSLQNLSASREAHSMMRSPSDHTMRPVRLLSEVRIVSDSPLPERVSYFNANHTLSQNNALPGHIASPQPLSVQNQKRPAWLDRVMSITPQRRRASVLPPLAGPGSLPPLGALGASLPPPPMMAPLPDHTRPLPLTRPPLAQRASFTPSEPPPHDTPSPPQTGPDSGTAALEPPRASTFSDWEEPAPLEGGGSDIDTRGHMQSHAQLPEVGGQQQQQQQQEDSVMYRHEPALGSLASQ